MELTSPLFVILITTGPIFILAALIMRVFPPKKINSLYGYRTGSSMKTQERWDFAQRFSAKQMIIVGSILTLSSGLGLVLHLNPKIELTIGLSILVFGALFIGFTTEREIKTKFGEK